MKTDHSKIFTNQTFITKQQQAMNYSEALRLLKDAEQRLQRKKKQIKVDSIRAQRGKWHAQQQEKKAQLHKSIKDESQKLQSKFEALKAKQVEKLAQLKKQSEKTRQQNLKKRSLSRLELLENKIRVNSQMREQSLHHTQKIIHIREQQLQKKRSNRLSLYGSRKQSRVVYEQFQASRVSDIRSSQSRQRDELLRILKKRQRQLKQLQKSENSRVKVDKQASTAQNLKSIDSSLKIYNPSYKERKRSLSNYPFKGQIGTIITQI